MTAIDGPGVQHLPNVFRPITVGTMALDHRLVVPTHSANSSLLLGSDEGFEHYAAHWVGKVEGGIQWIGGGPTFVRNPLPPGFESTGVGAHGPGLFRHPLYPSRIAELARRVHAAGGFLTTQMVLQGGLPIAPSNTLSGYLDHRIPHALDLDEVAWLIREYGESAALAADGGVDAIELHANHDDLLQWFLSPLTNHRTDAYGGDFEGRRRLLREVVESIRFHVQRPVTVGLRLCIDEMIDGGYGIDECQRIVAAFTDEATVDYFSLDVGNNWGVPSYIPIGSYPEGHWAALCGEVKAATHLPVVYVGRVAKPDTAEAILAAGHADLVGAARALIADPRFLAKAAAGQRDTIRPCIGVNECINRQMVEGLTFACAVNPYAGREGGGELAAVVAARRVLVVGGGPAGMELAGLAAERGHEVTLWERNDWLGGQLHVAAKLRMNARYAEWITWQARRLADVGVRVVLGHEASAAAVAEVGADVVVVATGAAPRGLSVAGTDQPHVVQAAAVINGAVTPGRRVAVVAEDDRPAPLVLADHLAAAGHEVTVVFQSPSPAPLVGKYTNGAILAALDSAGVELVPTTRVIGIDGPTLRVAHSYSGRRFELGPFDSVVLACGAVPVDGLYHELRQVHPAVHLLGDAYAPRRLVHVVRQAFELASILD